MGASQWSGEMTEIIIGKESLLHLLKNEGINAVLEEPGEDEVHGNIVAAHGFSSKCAIKFKRLILKLYK